MPWCYGGAIRIYSFTGGAPARSRTMPPCPTPLTVFTDLAVRKRAVLSRPARCAVTVRCSSNMLRSSHLLSDVSRVRDCAHIDCPQSDSLAHSAFRIPQSDWLGDGCRFTAGAASGARSQPLYTEWPRHNKGLVDLYCPKFQYRKWSQLCSSQSSNYTAFFLAWWTGLATAKKNLQRLYDGRSGSVPVTDSPAG